MIRFLRQLLRRFVGSASKPSLPSSVQSDELLGRFLFSREHFAETKGLVKPKGFLPDKDGETSVFRITDLADDAIWTIGNAIRPEKAKARGDVITNIVRRANLRVEPATQDHPRHAVIVGWPEPKHEKLMLATLLSKDATLHIQKDFS